MYIQKISAYIAVYLLFFSAISCVYSQGNTVILIKGAVVDDQNGKPIGAELFFINSKGKKIPTKCNSIDGSFQQVISTGETYTVIAKNYMIPFTQSTFTIPSSGQYTEITRDFRLKKISSGMELSEFNAFNPNDSALILTRSYPLETLKEFLSNNIKVSVQIAVFTQDSYFKSTKRTVKVQDKKKVRTKTINISAEDQLKDLANARINSIKDYLNSIKVPERNIIFKPEIRPGKASSSKAPVKKGKSAAQPVNSMATIKITVARVIELD